MTQRQNIMSLYNSRVAGKQNIKFVDNKIDTVLVLYNKMVKPTINRVDNKKDTVLELYNRNADKYAIYKPNFETQ